MHGSLLSALIFFLQASLVSLVVLPPVHAQGTQQCTVCENGVCWGDYYSSYIASSPQEAIAKWFTKQYENYPLLQCRENGQLISMLPTWKWWTTGVTTTTQGRRGQYRYYEVGHSGLYYGDVINNLNSACVHYEAIYVDGGPGPIVRCFEPLSSTISLSGKTETHPAGTDGISTIELTAKVVQGGSPKAGVAISLSVDVTPNSGGHEHHDVNRPKGSLSGTQGITDGNGEVRLTFIAPEVAGIHTVKASCSNCSNSPATKDIQVKVPDLMPISPDPPRNGDGSYVYALTSVDQIHEGSARYHRGQYWLAEQARRNLTALIESFDAAGWGTVALNDASMYWGGRYDVNGNWAAPHQGHRKGKEIDISFTRARNPISASKQQLFYKRFCEDKATETPFSILHHFVKLPHFHVYLDKQKNCNRTEN